MPNFEPNSVHGAKATFFNRKSVGFDYTASLYMGVGWTEMASASFHLNAGELKAVLFRVTMPATPGTYPVYFIVTSEGVGIGTFVATEDVIIKEAAWVSPNSDNAPVGWFGFLPSGAVDYSTSGLAARDGDILTFRRAASVVRPYAPFELYTSTKTCGAVKILARTTYPTAIVNVEVRRDGTWQLVAVLTSTELYYAPFRPTSPWIVITFTPGIVDAIRITPQKRSGDNTDIHEVMFLDGVTVPA